MKIIITHGYSLEQKGDSSLLVVTIRQIKEVFPDAQIEAQIMEKTIAGNRYEDVPVMDSIILIALSTDVSGMRRVFSLLYRLPAYVTWAWITRLTGRSKKRFLSARMYKGVNAIYEADLVVPVAGGYLSGEPGLFSTANLVFILLPLWIAHTLKKPVIHFPQSIGPFMNNFQRLIVGKTLKKATLIITRESMSAEYVKRLGIDPKKVIGSIDVGFLFTPAKDFNIANALEKNQVLPLNKKLVGITTKVHLLPAAQARYERELALFADWLCGKGMTPMFIPQITATHERGDDRVINRRVHALMKERDCALTIEKNLTNYETRALIDKLDYMVGTRFHSVIFALTGNVPSIAIEYEHKTSGIMRDLGLEEWVIKMDTVTAEKLEKLFKKLIIQEKQYREHLTEALPSYIKRADEMLEMVAKTYKNINPQ